ncbi:uncharacterized protein LOC128557308 [Mercenaria mercenaria]|uniref:uncharacterized protein LOC128557308 n=1 Tax=Mercenaria mercenaria TaxID=6596 RepID=UPI00234EC7F5|nr:uncharacterized protein LOC128557308 [Mercenaria mercenaria]
MQDSADTVQCWRVAASGDWEKVFTGFSFREYRQILIQATIVYIKLNVEHCTNHRMGQASSKKAKPSDVEVILDPDIYHSEHGIVSIGSSHLDSDISFPIKYSAELWPALKSALKFPNTELQTGHHVGDIDIDQQCMKMPYFTVIWAGLNSRVLLCSHLPLGHVLKDNSSMLNILTGTALSNTLSEPGNQYGDLQQVISTAKDCVDKRFLVVLDCYQGDTENTEIMVNRAVPTGS